MAARKPAKAKKPAKVGRPSKCTPAVVAAICSRLSKGEPLAAICRDEGMPHDSTVRDWAEKDTAISRDIARAREAGEEWLLAECLEIADDSRNDFIERKADEGDEKALAMRENGEVIQRSKLRIDTRLKLLAKWNPKKWGERLDLNHAGKVTLEQLVAGTDGGQ